MNTGTTSAKSSTRLTCWDNIKGALIFLVVFGHFLFAFQDTPFTNHLVDVIYFFHMPAFVFVSGFFSKSTHARQRDQLLKLLCAYILLTACHLTLAFLKGEALQIVEPYYSAWYLLTLIVWRLITPGLVSAFSWKLLPACALVSLIAGFWPEIDNNIFGLAKLISLYPFFLAGYFLPREKVDSIAMQPVKRRYPLGVVCFIVAAAITIASAKLLGLSDPDYFFLPYVSPMKFRLAGRVAIWCISALCIYGFMLLSIHKKLPVITDAGKNSLSIYLIHRPLTLLCNRWMSMLSPALRIVTALVLTILILVLFGNDRFARLVNRLLTRMASLLCTPGLYRLAALTVALALFSLPVARIALSKLIGTSEPVAEHTICRVLPDQTRQSFDDAFTLLFAGDLILLEDQVKNGFTDNGYDFSDVFEYTRDYISAADFAVGVFEGPCAGITDDHGFSSSNYDDGKRLYINFPEEWPQAVKDAGFDLVTTANNHLLDCGTEGALRTLKVLDQIGLDHTGSYANASDKNAHRVHLVETGGLRLAFLSYISGCNNTPDSEFIDGQYTDFTSIITAPGSPFYTRVVQQVEQDFVEARAANPDCIIVMPHWGTQFADEPDSLQLAWEENFKRFGADIILGDHTHSVQPVKVEEYDGRQVFTLYCPGNYANIYREYNGDCTALAEVYIDRETKSVIGGAIVPMWTQSPYRGNYRSIPIYRILTDPALGMTISTSDMERVEAVQKHITSTMLGTELDLNMLQDRYRFDAQGFARVKNTSVALTDAMRQGTLYSLLTQAHDVCFVGDSITEGTKNGGVPWYEPLESLIPGEAINRGWGASTVRSLLRDHLSEITQPDADLFVIAIGTNDIRYRDSSQCAMDADAYIAELTRLRGAISEAHPDARFAFIAPWYSTDGDLVSQLDYPEKLDMNRSYTEALRAWTDQTGDAFIDPNPALKKALDTYPHSDYMVDYIHPNATTGVELYAAAVLEY